MKHGLILFAFLFVFTGMFASSLSYAAEAPDGKTVMNEMISVYYYSHIDEKSQIQMRIVNRQSQVRQRRLTMLRLDKSDGGEQFYYVYFHEPADVQGMSFLVLKHPRGNDDRWLYLPAIDLVKRIATNDKRTSFAGSDFTYEDISGRDLDEDEHILEGEETLGEYSAFVVKSTPKHAGEAEFSTRKFWIDKATHLPLKVEHYDLKGTLYKVYETQEIQNIKDTPTITKAVMKDIDNERFTEITLQDISYDVGMTSDLFQERSLRMPPSKWIQ